LFGEKIASGSTALLIATRRAYCSWNEKMRRMCWLLLVILTGDSFYYYTYYCIFFLLSYPIFIFWALRRTIKLKPNIQFFQRRNLCNKVNWGVTLLIMFTIYGEHNSIQAVVNIS
jgi:hypothetical protein